MCSPIRVNFAQQPQPVAELMQQKASLTVIDGNVVEVRFPPSLKVDFQHVVDRPISDARWALNWIPEYGVFVLSGKLGTSLNREPIENQDLKLLNDLKNVTLVDARFTNITDEGLKTLQQLPFLQYLDVSATRVTGQGLASFGNCGQLHTLFAAGIQIDDDSAFLQNCEQLEVLNLAGTRLGSKTMERIVKLPNLRELSLQGAVVNGNDLPTLASINRLERLDLSGIQINRAVLTSLSSHPNLRQLILSTTKMDDEVQKFKEQNPLVDVTVSNDADVIVLPLLKQPEK